MRSFLSRPSLKSAAAAAILVAVPLAGAYARGHHTASMDEPITPTYYGSRLQAVLGDVQGVDNGIADAQRERLITPATARRLESQAAGISRSAERTAAADHGKLPGADYRKLMDRIDTVNQALLSDTGSGFNMGDGSDGGHYPNG